MKVQKARVHLTVTCASVCALLLVAGSLPLRAQSSSTPPIRFEVPAVVDPIHTNGEPDIGIDVFGRVLESGPTGTGTQRSTDRKSTRLNSSHGYISYAVFCLKKKKKERKPHICTLVTN